MIELSLQQSWRRRTAADRVGLMTTRFRRYELRTTDADAARGFYAKLLGHERAIVWPLHEQARARGAVAHWLGSIEVASAQDLERASAGFVERGATLLGPTRPTPGGGQVSVLRDPGGAIVAVATHAASELVPTVDVSWHALNTNDLPSAIANYGALFGWNVDREPRTGPGGAFHEFRWDEASRDSAGAMSDIAGRPEVHPHWLYFFDVPSLDSAVEWTRQAGGTAMNPVETPAGDRISVCEDPQRAAFGILERKRAS